MSRSVVSILYPCGVFDIVVRVRQLTTKARQVVCDGIPKTMVVFQTAVQ